MKYFITACCLFLSVSLFAQAPELIVPAGHGDQVYLTKFSTDGNFLFSVGTGAKAVKVWDTKNGRLLKNLAVGNFPTSLQSTADSRQLIVTTKTEIYLYDFPSLKLTHKIAHGAADAVAGNNSLYVLYAESQTGFKITAIDLVSFQEKNLYSDAAGSAAVISLSPQGDKLFFASGFTVKILNIAADAIDNTTSPAPGNIFMGYTPSGNLISFNDKGKKGFIPGINDGSNFAPIRNLDAKVPVSYALPSLKNQIAYSGNEQVCLSGDEAIFVLNYVTGKKVREIKTPHEDIIAMDVFGNKLVAGDKFKGTLKQYDLSTGNLVRIYGEDAIAPIVWETASNATGIIIDGIFDSPCGYFSGQPDGRIVTASFQNETNELMSIVGISADASITATYNQKEVQVYKSPAFDKPAVSFDLDDKQVASLGISPDNKKLLVAYKNYVDVFDVASGSLVKEIPNDLMFFGKEKLKKNEYLDYTASTFSFSDDSRYVAVMVNKNATVFDLTQNKSVATLNEDRIEAIRIAADGKKLYYVKNRTSRETVKWGEFDVMNPAPPVETFVNLDLDEMRITDYDVQKTNVSISPDLKFIACIRNDEVLVYNRRESTQTRVLKGHQSYATQVRWLTNGTLVSSGNDNTIRFWDATKGVEILKLVMFTNGSWVMVTPNGQFDASEDAMKKLYYVQGIQTIPLDNLMEKFYTPKLLAQLLSGAAIPEPDVDVNTLATAPKVKLSFDAARNLEVGDDVPKIDWANENISVTVNAECTEDAIDEVRLYLNGKLIESKTRNLVVENDNSKKNLSRTFTVKLSPGINSFKAIALNTQRTESQPDQADVNYKPANNVQPGVDDITLHLVVVGINNYKNPKYNLNYAKADAEAFKAEMEKASSLFKKTNTYFITDDQALKATIESTLTKIVSTAKPQDMFVFFYAGHGVMSDGAAKNEFFIVPYDVTQLYGAEDALAQKGISAKQLEEFSKNIPAQKQLFILDACQSAGALEIVASRGAAEEKAIAQLARSTGSHWLTSAGSDQFASEFGTLGHGVFTYALLQGLQGAADNGDKRITVNELKAWLEVQVPELSQKYKGSPQYPASYGFGNDFPLEVLK